MQCGRVGGRHFYLSPEDTISSGLFRLYWCMQWTDRIRQIKILLVLAAIFIAVISLLVSHYLVKDLSREERNKMEIWADALRTLNQADENSDLSLVLNVLQGNNTIPVIVMNAEGVVEDYRNIVVDEINKNDSDAYLANYAKHLLNQGRYIKVYLGDSLKSEDYQLVCYKESTLFKRLSY